MELVISESNGVPIYQQIVTQVMYLVSSGRLKPGEEVPSIRALAERIRVNPNTVARAYRELQDKGVLANRRTAGTFVAEGVSSLARREKTRILSERIDALLAESRQLGISIDEVIDLLKRRDSLMKPDTSEGTSDGQ